MNQWGANGAASSNEPKWIAKYLNQGAGKSNQAANNTALFGNSTPNSFVNTISVGAFGATRNKMVNASSEGPKIDAVGWNIRRAYQGPVVSVVASGGSGFANGETVAFSNGTTNAVVS